ncbi:serine dehydratase alpha chain-domain-containing protein [Microdochium trichocladiopsis]|uniref:Serine dehydratase alpha chain-domain-containing protein n=1 Tax=Microdochium trichocladiopsis TaxID=1682393 RepID=A0A9P8Y185_9PEZI|nr:serine dehydratase alpha chain-domain-containing protein [Microdochium trichocladiopsis]KAH7024967.1 serine dehydratase alpha chain-domain-containing protein [Microdochium trichocladiopsis]
MASITAQRMGRQVLRGAVGTANSIPRFRYPGRPRLSAIPALSPHPRRRLLTTTATSFNNGGGEDDAGGTYSEADREHAVISTFDLFSIGIGPSSSHTVGPMRAGNIFVADLAEAGLLDKVHKIRVTIYGSLALTGEGHMTPSALLLGLESADVETVDTAYVPRRFDEIKATGKLHLGRGFKGEEEGSSRGREIEFDYKKDFVWEWSKKLPLHSNGMRLMVFDENGDMLATNDMFSVGGGFVVNGAMSTAASSSSSSSSLLSSAEAAGQGAAATGGNHPVDLAENLFYKEIKRSDAAGDRRTGTEVIAPPEAEVANDKKMLDAGSSSSTTTSGESSALVSAGSTAATTTDSETGSSSSPDSQQPKYPFRDAATLLAMCKKHNLTIAQLVYENEKSHGYTDEEIHDKLFRIWEVMDNSILEAVQAPLNTTLPGSLKLHRRAPALYRRLTRGLYPSHTDRIPGSAAEDTAAAAAATARLSEPSSSSQKSEGEVSETAVTTRTRSSSPAPAPSSSPVSSTRSRALAAATKRNLPMIHGSLTHPILPSPRRRTSFPAMDYLTVYAIAVNETNACGGRVVTAPTNGAAGIIPSVLKYTLEFISDADDTDRDIVTFLLTAAAIGMIFKRGATISAAEGGCMAEVGVACSMAAAGFAAVHGAGVETIEMAAEIGIEHNLGLSCDPIASLVQAPCIERNALGSVKAVSSANLALSSNPQTMKVRLDDAVRAMRLTAIGMRSEFKETSLSGLATSVPIPVSVPDC